MATKRMFSEKIVCSDAFMEMPISTQALYFHLGMKVDDDGFVNPKMVMRMIGSGDDELKVLIGKRFVIPFENGVIVLKHHRINNNMDTHNHTPTVYTEQLKSLYLKDNKAYTLDPAQSKTSQSVASLTADCPQSLDKIRIDEKRLDKINNIKIEKKESKKERLNGGYGFKFESFWTAYPNKVAKGKAYEVFQLLTEELQTECVNAINKQVENNHFWKDWLNDGIGGDNPPHPTTWLNQKRWEDNVVMIERKGKRKLTTGGGVDLTKK